ncbi:MAG: fused response regulator/phosphatase [Gammaproteobacteria bacterium]|nr:fused response regulator/phosphatase [Gammaproteobacteria bacterium]
MKVLVVDDQKLNRSLLQHMLLQDGYEVVLAEDGYHALEQYEKESPDIVLLDVVMPNLDGYETAPRLKALAGEVYLPIIFITALGDQDSLKRCLDVGGDDFLNKPFDRVILQAKIQAHGRIRDLSIKTYEQKIELDYHRLQTEREHKIVEHIFNRALEGNYKVPHLLEFSLSPAAMFNGDIMLVEIGPTGNLYIMMGDFTGHGLSSAVGTLPVSRTFYSMAQKGMSVGDIAMEINRILLTLLPDDMFCAAAIVELNSAGKSLSIWAGGTPDMYLLQNGTGISQTIASQHMALGILENDEFDRVYDNYVVSNDNKLVLFTDGVVEAFNSKGEMFGYERLLALVDSPDLIDLEQIIKPLDEFRGDAERDDDISLLVLTCDAVNSTQEEHQVQYSQLPHSYSLAIDSDMMKTTDPVVEVVDMITQLQGADEHRSTLFLLLSEAYNNALDHGILKLDSKIKDSDDGFIEYYMQRDERLSALSEGQIDIEVTYNPDDTSFTFTVRDSGDGFNHEGAQIPHLKQELEHGRGNILLQELANNVKFNDLGNEITINYQLN